MDALTPAGPALRLSNTEHEHRPCYPTGLPASRARPLRPFRPQPPDRPRRRFLTLPLSATGFRYHLYRSGLHHSLAGSPVGRPYRVRFGCGLVAHLLLLSTPPRGDAVTVSYWPESVCQKRTLTSLSEHARRRTRSQLLLANKDGFSPPGGGSYHNFFHKVNDLPLSHSWTAGDRP